MEHWWAPNVLEPGKLPYSPSLCCRKHAIIGVRAIFSRGLSHLCPKKFSTAPEKTLRYFCKITLPDSPHRVIISKNPGFRALYLARQNLFLFLFNKYIFFHFWLQPPGSYAHACNVSERGQDDTKALVTTRVGVMPESTTLDDLERLMCARFQTFNSKYMHLSEKDTIWIIASARSICDSMAFSLFELPLFHVWYQMRPCPLNWSFRNCYEGYF